MPQTFDKDPDAVLDYAVDWEDWLGGDTIASSSWTVPAGITKDSDTHDDTTATVWVSGGAAGETYRLVNHIETAAGREEDRSIFIVVKQR